MLFKLYLIPLRTFMNRSSLPRGKTADSKMDETVIGSLITLFKLHGNAYKCFVDLLIP